MSELGASNEQRPNVAIAKRGFLWPRSMLPYHSDDPFRCQQRPFFGFFLLTMRLMGSE